MREYTLVGRCICGEQDISDGAVCVSDGKIVFAGERSGAPFMNNVTEYKESVIMPGFVDIHCHAGGKTWFHDDPVSCAEYQLKHGTTSVCATFYRDLGIDGMLEGLSELKKAMPNCPNIIGAHLEGPYLNPHFGSASDGEKVTVRREEYMPLLESGIIRHVTFAPEVEGTDMFLSDLNEKGIVASVGHSCASPDEVRRAEKNGVKNVTHLFDATGASISPTRWDGTIEADFNVAALLSDSLTYEIICDSRGVHVRPEMVALVRKIAGVSRIIGITDACGGEGDGSDLNFVNGELMGSKLTMNHVARNFRALGFTYPEIAAVSSANPARLLGLSDRGSLEAGKKADIVVLNDDFSVEKVYIAK